MDACRDAATSEHDRCRWDIRHFGHQAGIRERAAPVKAVRTQPAQLSLF